MLYLCSMKTATLNLFTAAIAGTLLLTALLTNACRTTHQQANTHAADSLLVVALHDTLYLHLHDTLNLHLRDSAASRQRTQVNFVPAGGTVNLQSGTLTGVSRLSIEHSVVQLRDSLLWQSRLTDLYRQRADILLRQNRSLNEQLEQNREAPKQNPFRIFLYGLAAGLLLAFLVRVALFLLSKRYPLPF